MEVEEPGDEGSEAEDLPDEKALHPTGTEMVVADGPGEVEVVGDEEETE